MFARSLALIGVVLSFALAGCSERPLRAADVDTSVILAADDHAGDWLTHGRTYCEQRFSPLEAIDASNVTELGLAWSAELATSRGASATPIVVDGVMYVTSAWSVVHAFDAKTGAAKWTFDPEVPRTWGQYACCDVVNRGLALYEGKLFVGTIDGRLIAIDAASGAKLWDVDTINKTPPYTITGAPRVANGLVYIGNGGGEYGVRGYVSAYDVDDGALVWRFYTVPGDPAKGPDGAASDAMLARMSETWTGEWWSLGGGGTVWDAIVYDPDFDQLIVGVGNGSPWNQKVRSPEGGDNLFLASILALDAKTGAYKWHYQTTPGETWDYTATQPIMLADLEIEGRTRKVAMQAPKNGFFYVVDREDGALISAKPIVPMAPEAATPPGAPISWSTGEIDARGRPVENPSARYQAATAIVHPSSYGAHNWHPMAFSPETGLVYIPVQEIFQDWTDDSRFALRAGRWNTATFHAPLPAGEAVRDAIRNSWKGYLLAWNPVTQTEAWRAPLASPWNGGALATAGGLVFQGAASGEFSAYDAASGEKLWSFDNQAATLAGPVSYEVDGEQYVAVLAGYGSVFFLTAGFAAPEIGNDLPGRVYVFKLGAKTPAPALALEPIVTPEPPVIRASAATLARGELVFNQFCAVCHGAGAVSGGVIPDLRRSGALHDPAAWTSIVVDGALDSRGMPKLGEWVPADDAEATRAWVAGAARILYEREQAAAASTPRATPTGG